VSLGNSGLGPVQRGGGVLTHSKWKGEIPIADWKGGRMRKEALNKGGREKVFRNYNYRLNRGERIKNNGGKGEGGHHHRGKGRTKTSKTHPLQGRRRRQVQTKGGGEI